MATVRFVEIPRGYAFQATADPTPIGDQGVLNGDPNSALDATLVLHIPPGGVAGAAWSNVRITAEYDDYGALKGYVPLVRWAIWNGAKWFVKVGPANMFPWDLTSVNEPARAVAGDGKAYRLSVGRFTEAHTPQAAAHISIGLSIELLS